MSNSTKLINVQGIQGPTGAQGPQGIQGPSGPQGIQGPAGSGTGTSTSSALLPVDVLWDWDTIFSLIDKHSSDSPLNGVQGAAAAFGVASADSPVQTTSSKYTTTLQGDIVLQVGPYPSANESAGIGKNYVISKPDSTTYTHVSVNVKQTSNVAGQILARAWDMDASAFITGVSQVIQPNTWVTVSLDISSVPAGHRVVFQPTLTLNNLTSQTFSVLLSTAFKMKQAQVVDTVYADRINDSYANDYKLRVGQQQGGLLPDAKVAYTAITDPYGTGFTFLKSGKYFYDAASGGAGILLQSLGQGTGLDDNDTRTLEIFARGTNGTLASFSNSVHCNHLATRTSNVGSRTDTNYYYRKLVFQQMMGWICVDHVDDIPAPLVDWPQTHPTSGAATYVRGYATRFLNRERDMDLYIRDLVNYVPQAVRSALFNDRLFYTLGYSLYEALNGAGVSGAEAYTEASPGLSAPPPLVVMHRYGTHEDIDPKFYHSSAQVIVHETAHVVDIRWIVASNPSGPGTLTVNGTTFDRMINHPDIVSMYAAVQADPNMNHSLYAYYGGRVEWWAECLSERWMQLEVDLMQSMGAKVNSSTYTYSNNTFTVFTTGAHGLSVGDYVVVDNHNGSSGARGSATASNLVHDGIISGVPSNTEFTFIAALPNNMPTSGNVAWASSAAAYARRNAFRTFCTGYGF